MSEIVRVGNGNRDIEKVMTNELETAEENGVLLIDTQDQYEGIDEKLDVLLDMVNKCDMYKNMANNRSSTESTISLTEIDSNKTTDDWSGYFIYDENNQAKKITDYSIKDDKHLDDDDDDDDDDVDTHKN